MSRSLIDAVLEEEAISVVFQPVFEMNGSTIHPPKIHFLECLSRGPAGTNMESASVLFEYARRKGKETALDRLCFEKAFRTVSGLPNRPAISLNVHASTLEREPGFASYLTRLASEHAIPLSEIVLEIVEQGADWNAAALSRVLDELKGFGVRIALDDIGLGQSNYRMILECRPDYFKLDRYLIQGCHGDCNRQALIESLVMLASKLEARVVAEGIETQDDLDEVRRSGVNLIQGFLLARPTPVDDLDRFIEIDVH